MSADGSRWRLILDDRAMGPWNMGMDEALFASVLAGGPPTLRLYRWNGPWLSLGYSQRLSSARLAACRDAGVGVVRRVSGGRAVLHGGDLTYAIAARESSLPAGLHASYAAVCRALLSALAQIDVNARSAPEGAAAAVGGEFDCFANAAGHEIGVGGQKLVGSAQRRAGGGLLQHGSIRVVPDPRSAARACQIRSDSATSLSEIGRELAPGALEQACVVGFSEILNCRFELDVPSRIERTQASLRVEQPLAIPEPSEKSDRVLSPDDSSGETSRLQIARR